jgi:hypothetical protein
MDTQDGSALPANKIDVVGGDFVGRDGRVFIGVQSGSTSVTAGPFYNGTSEREQFAEEDPAGLDRITLAESQITQLRGRVTRLIPAERFIAKCSRLREPTTIADVVGGEVSVGFTIPCLGDVISKWFTKRETNKCEEDMENVAAMQYLKELSDIEAEIFPKMEPKELSRLLQRLSRITDEVNVRIANLNASFTALVYPAAYSGKFVEKMVAKIGHQELRDEATMHLNVTKRLVEKLEKEKSTDKRIDVLSDEAQAAVAIITELEKHHQIAEQLVGLDRQWRNKTLITVTVYLVVVIAFVSVLIWLWSDGLDYIGSIHTMKLPLLGVPWPVIVWSLLGSLGAMIHRFNKKPIYAFGVALKWLITRPVQGVVLGSALYFALVSGLFLLTGFTVDIDGSPQPTITDAVILVLVFLIGFSDRFADSVLNTLVAKYSKESEQNAPRLETLESEQGAPRLDTV